jgi:RecQ family ATP-dependent DNA helicase
MDPVLPVLPSPSPPSLRTLLRERFGHAAFRPHQEAVCSAAAHGDDVLLVMPTGAGKSLCYQLPAIARGGTALVVSPLIALMEDQVQKLKAQGFRAERIHSGRSRDLSRAACIAYLNGQLDFLFFAPERLGVQGFPEMLARRTPSLIAIDEAHCISQWGHDFRPEYRMLGERLPKLRPAPVLALTATATPQVQDDIVAQLRLIEPRRLIHGFRRTNIAMEVVDAPPKARHELAAKVIASPEARPAILYTSSRKDCEAVAEEFEAEGLSCAAYHAGLPADRRAAVQRAFLAGEIEVVIATIAFGMGIDKPDVRSVVHLALPGSVEAYSQEVGRAGRDGKPSRAVLLCSWSDRRTHEFFLDRSYPPPGRLQRLVSVLDDEPRGQDWARKASGLSDEMFESALDKLWVHGGVLVDADQRLRKGSDAWRDPYAAQRRHKEDAIDRMMRFADGGRCRVLSVLDHFGDKDGGGPCGICDQCAPERAVLSKAREPDANEVRVLEAVIEELAGAPRDGLSTGKLFQATGEKRGLDRKEFENLLRSLQRTGSIALEDTSWVKDGKTIAFVKARLLQRPTGTLAMIQARTKGARESEPRKSTRRKSRLAAHVEGRGTGSTGASRASAEHVEALRQFRLAAARQTRLPAFRILTDAALLAMAGARPTSLEELLAVRGIGKSFVDKYGRDVLTIFQADA